jgi:hypothetical protein
MDKYIQTVAVVFGALLIFLMASPAMGQPHKYFYHADREIVLEGIIQNTEAEQRYRGRSQFLIIFVKGRSTQENFIVELCPAWFLDWDLLAGQPVKITGSVTQRRGEFRLIIARKITYKERTKELRDKYGFPNWRGGRRRR